MDAITPLYGRFIFGTQVPLQVLMDRLQQITDQFLDQTPFHAYLTTKDGQTFYGLSHEELAMQYKTYEGNVRSFSTSSIATDFRVVRVHIHFDPIRDHAKAQFVIAARDRRENQLIRAILLGEPLPNLPKTEGKSAKSNDKEEPLVPFFPPSSGYKKANITLSDNFYFDRQLSIYALLALLDELSDKFMDYRSFHAQLETTDGDYYFDIQREELRYMFNQRRHTLLTLFLDVTNRQGHWIDLMLSFHPLAKGPNAEIEISAPASQVDDVTDLIWNALSVEAGRVFPDEVDRTFEFDVPSFSVDQFIELFNRVSVRYVFQVPPVVEVVTKNQKAYKGLSFFQLRRIFKEHQSAIAHINLEMLQVITGRNCSLSLDFTNSTGHLKVSLANQEHHVLIEKLVLAWFRSLVEKKETPPPGQAAPGYTRRVPDLSRPTATCFLSLSKDKEWTRTLQYELENTLSSQGFHTLRDRWVDQETQTDPFQKMLGQADLMIVNVDAGASDAIYKVGIAHAMKKRVILVTDDAEAIPQDLRQLPHLVFHGNTRRFDQFMARLMGLVGSEVG